jgi:hypothetical protein
MDITLPKRSIQRFFLGAWALVVVAGGASVYAEYVLHSENYYWIQLFGLAYEQNLPTWYVSGLFLLCSLLLAMIAATMHKQRRPYVIHWGMLALAFLYISCDETATIHEHCCGRFNAHGIFYYGWVIPGSIVVASMGFLLLKFLADLPSRTRTRFMVAATFYVGGALMLDMLCGYLHDHWGTDILLYGIVDLIEESLEILGITLFLFALLDYVHPDSDALRLLIQGARFGDHPTRSEESDGERPESSTAMVPLQASEMAGELPIQGFHG